MTDQPASSQSIGTSYPKTFTPYSQPIKTFQPYISPTLGHNNPVSHGKNHESKSEQIKFNKYNYSPPLVSSISTNGTGFTSPKFQNSLAKSIPSFLEIRNMMKSSMINTEQQSPYLKRQPKLEPNGFSSPLETGKKISRLIDHPDMKLSSIELGGQGYKVPSFLNKQKKVPYSPGLERPQSSKQLLNPKDIVSTNEGSLNSSYGNLRKNKGDENSRILEIKSIQDPTQQWTKLSWNKRKQKAFTINDFEQIRQLGTGKYGKVYLAKEKQTNFICALKILEKGLIKQQEITEQLIRELKIQTYLNHTNIIKMYGFFDDPANIYLIMQAAIGGQLFKQLKKHQSMPQAKVASIMRQVCCAIVELHSNRIIHRDIKPQNIVLHDNVIKLCDFGWSVYCDSNLRTTFCGTPLYVGPEILKGKEYDQKIDIWSLGVMMYEMLVGENPFRITKEEELIKIIKDDITIPSYVQISPQAKNFLFACLQKNPNDRLSIRELVAHDFFKKHPEKVEKKIGI